MSAVRAEVSGMVDELVEKIAALGEANHSHPAAELLDTAKYVQNTVVPAMSDVREVADRLEAVVPDSLWPLPKYSEILFIK